MTAYYDITEKLKELLDNEPFNKTVVLGDTDFDLDEVDNDKHVLFPLTHIIVQRAVVTGNTITFEITLVSLDVVDFNKDAPVEPFKRNDNQQDVLNSRLALLVRIYKRVKDLTDLQYQVTTDMELEPFNEAYENNLAGWRGAFQITVPNDMTKC